MNEYGVHLPRRVCPERLDTLPPSDPIAIRARADLRRIHRFMGTQTITLPALRRAFAASPPKRILELGAGDGTLMLRLARKLREVWPDMHVTLLDRQNVVSLRTIHAFHALGWDVETLIEDVLDWSRKPLLDQYDLIVANLFLHHFDTPCLAPLLEAIAARANRAVFICEPRRALAPLLASHMIGLIGASAVTRGDAVLSVHAGFRGNELSTLWPVGQGAWRLSEYSAGLFSQCFLAIRE